MANPQESEVRRSGNIPALNPDATESVRQADRPNNPSDSRGPVPPDQRPGHRPDRDQDKPDPASFAVAMGIRSDDELAGKGRSPRQRSIVFGVVGVGIVVCLLAVLKRRKRRR